jgi:Arabinose efflux permease
MSQSITNTLVSSYAAILGAGAMLIGLLTGLYFGIAVAMRPFAGPAVVRLDKKKLLIFANSLGILVNFLYGAFNNIPLFIVARVLHGIQFSIIGSLIITIAGDSLPKEKLGSGLGIFGMANVIPTAIGSTVGLAIRTWGTEHFGALGGYKAIFYVATIFMVFSLIPSFFIEPVKRTKEELASTGPWYKNIIALPTVTPSICNMLLAIASALFSAYLVPYAIEKGFVGISLYFTFNAAAVLVSRPFFGKLVDKYGGSIVFIPCVVIFMVAFIMIFMAQSITMVYAAGIVAGLGYGGAFPSIQAVCLQTMPSIKRGVASNTNFLGMDLGMFLGPTLGGMVITKFLYTGRAYSILYLTALIPLALSIVVMLIFKKSIENRIKEVSAME